MNLHDRNVIKGILMSHPFCKAIEFYGGPVDGCAETFASPLEPLIVVHSRMNAPSNHWLLRVFRLLSFRDPWRISPIYFYRLTDRKNDLRYQFVGTGTATSLSTSSGLTMVKENTIHLCMKLASQGL